MRAGPKVAPVSAVRFKLWCARYWVLRMLLDHFSTGDHLVRSRSSGLEIYAQVREPPTHNVSRIPLGLCLCVDCQGFVDANGVRRALVVNKWDQPAEIMFSVGGGSGTMYVIDGTTGNNPPAESRYSFLRLLTCTLAPSRDFCK